MFDNIDLSQFGPTDEDKRQAKQAGLMSLAAAMFGTRRGYEGEGISRGITGYLGGQQATLKDLMAQRQSGIQQTMEMQKMKQAAQMQDWGMGLVNGAMGGQGGPPVQGGMQSAPTGADVQTAPYNPDGQQAPMSPPGNYSSGQPSNTGPQVGGLSRVFMDPNIELGFGMMGNPTVATILNRNRQQALDIKPGPNGELVRNGVVIGRSMPNGTVIYQNGDPSQAQFIPIPAAALKLAAQQAGAVKGAESSADEAARNPFRVSELTMPDGSKQQVTGDQIQAFLRGGANGLPGNVGRTPNPIDQAATLAEREALGKGYATQAEKIDTDAATAKVMLARLQEMDRYTGQIQTGMGAETRLQIARTAKAVGLPDEFVQHIANGDIAAMQAFRKQSVQMAFEGARQQMGGVPRSVQEIQYQMEANPGLALEPAANKTINDWLQGVARFSEAKQQAKDKWLDKNGTMRGFEGDWNAKSDARQFLQQFDQSHPTVQADAKPSAPAGVDKQTGKPLYRRQDGKLYFAP